MKRYGQGMKYENHPLMQYLAERGETLAAFSERTGTSRMHLYRMMQGGGASVSKLVAISEATGGRVPVTAFIKGMEASQ